MSTDLDLRIMKITDDDDVRLVGTSCQSCGEVTLAAKDACPNCGSVEVTPVTLSCDGTVWSFTVCHHEPPKSWRIDVDGPHVLALIELPEGLRVMAPLLAPLDAITIGQKVTITPMPLRDGIENLVGFAFVPRKEA